MTLAIDKVDGYGTSNRVSCTPDKEDKVDTIEGRHINYLAVATKQSTSLLL